MSASMDEIPEESDTSLYFKCFVHFPQIEMTENERVTVQGGSKIGFSPDTALSNLAAVILNNMFKKGEIEGKTIMKADSVKVFIQLRDNWRAHPVEDYGTEMSVTLQETFGEMLNLTDQQISIHVHLCNEKEWNEEKVRTAIKKLLEVYSQTHLERLFCPISQGMLSQIVRDQYHSKLSVEKIKMFGAWFEKCGFHSEKCNNGSSSNSNFTPCRGKKIIFSPVKEVPQLRKWYEENPKPNAEDLTHYAELLNRSEYRQSRDQVTFRHVNTWFKNERARLRRESLSEEDFSRQMQGYGIVLDANSSCDMGASVPEESGESVGVAVAK